MEALFGEGAQSPGYRWNPSGADLPQTAAYGAVKCQSCEDTLV